MDYTDEFLARSDWVIASIYSDFKMDNTARIITAIKNPQVHGIGHLTGRSISIREAYPLDLDKIFRVAAKYHTFIEINSKPWRKDLNDQDLKRAKLFGVKFIISTDAHNIKSFWLMELGIGIAKRGWLEPSDIINTWSWPKITNYLKKLFLFLFTSIPDYSS